MLDDNTIFTHRSQSRSEVVGYKDPITKAMIVWPKNRQEDNSNPYTRFRKEALTYAVAKCTEQIELLSQLSQEEREGYKPLTTIQRELTEYLTDGVDFVNDIQKQINLLTTKPLPPINEYVVFADEEIESDVFVTGKLHYDNPANQTLTKEQHALVHDFLDVFLDDYNKGVLGWYLGAALLNIPVYDDRISKMMIVGSNQSGSGKSTLINTLVKALFTSRFSTVSPNFDWYFSSKNRFATANIPETRVNVYSEAEWAETHEKNIHDFSGLNASIMKSMLTEGLISEEEKHGKFYLTSRSSMHIVLSNYAPVVSHEMDAFNRRILPLIVKPTRMLEKAKALNLVGYRSFEKFVEDNVQAFANYFVSIFRADQYRFTEIDYDYNEYVQEIGDSAEDIIVAKEEKRANYNQIKSADGLVGIISAVDDVKFRPLIDEIVRVMGGGTSDRMRRDGDMLYLDSAKNHYMTYGHDGMELRKVLEMAYGRPTKRYHKRMYAIPISEVSHA